MVSPGVGRRRRHNRAGTCGVRRGWHDRRRRRGARAALASRCSTPRRRAASSARTMWLSYRALVDDEVCASTARGRWRASTTEAAPAAVSSFAPANPTAAPARAAVAGRDGAARWPRGGTASPRGSTPMAPSSCVRRVCARRGARDAAGEPGRAREPRAAETLQISLATRNVSVGDAARPAVDRPTGGAGINTLHDLERGAGVVLTPSSHALRLHVDAVAAYAAEGDSAQAVRP